ncbi:DEAD/DEAH box helicase family protein [Psychrobacillus sp. FSL H8-0487]|uniref:DEAD/DEAH box helicase family protein n=1 Tax=Psychrobacillus sp. FSL H8-0487 TaxID=2921391 RepID=UPI0030FB6CA3
MTVSDLISLEEVEAWNSGDIITIAAPTGKGKSHFIKNSVYEVAKQNGKRILFLVHRTNCYTQFADDLQEKVEDGEIVQEDKTDIIDLKTYQSIDMQNSNKNIPDFNLNKYDYIVCDEFHYFMSDASFNGTTDVSLEAILNESDAVRILVSATSKYMKYYLKELNEFETIDYEFEPDTNFIERLEFYYNDNVLEKYIDGAIKKQLKSIFFIDNTKKAYELHMKYKDITFFNCAKGNDYYRYVNDKQIENMLINKGFDKVDEDGNEDSTAGKLILITTSVMDAGVSILDDDLKHIVCDIKDTEKLIQCIGRKRRKEGEKIILHIKALSNKQLGGIESSAKINNKHADYLKEHGEIEYIKEYGREYDKTNTIYIKNKEEGGLELVVNEMRYTHNFIKYKEMLHMKKFNSKHNYCEYIKSKFKAEEYTIYSLESEQKKIELENYLSGILGNRLSKNEQKELIEIIDLKVNGRMIRSYEKLNQGLEMLNLKYRITAKKSNSTRYWTIEKLK